MEASQTTPAQSLRSPSDSALTTDPRDQGVSHDDCDAAALNDFARWFADWWTRRGRTLTDAARDDA